MTKQIEPEFVRDDSGGYKPRKENEIVVFYNQPSWFDRMRRFFSAFFYNLK